MGLRICSDEWVRETLNELESYKKGYAKMIKEHDAVLKSYRDLRDSKDATIEELHAEIEMHKRDKLNLRKDNERLRKMIAYYEAERRANGSQRKAVV